MAKHRSKFLKMQAKTRQTYRARVLHSDGSQEVLGDFHGRGWNDPKSRLIRMFNALTDDGSDARKTAQNRKDSQG